MILFLSILLLKTATALGPVKFGPEFTFVLDRTAAIQRDIDTQFQRHLVENQPKDSKFTVNNAYHSRVTYTSPNGWWFSVMVDHGAQEIGMSPMTVERFKHFAADIQDAIFVSAANSGHFPALWHGGGHINVDVTEFRKNPMLFRNFVVDFFNHNELYMGIWNYDHKNAKVHQLDSGGEETILSVIGKIDTLGPEMTYEKVLSEFHVMDAYGWSIYFYKTLDHDRVEIRSVRPQASMDVFIRQIELIEHRMKYLEQFNKPIPYKMRVPVEPLDNQLIPPVEPQLALRSYYEYVTESGLEWRNHRDYLWPQWTTGGEIEKFEQSDWFMERERERCQIHLAKKAMG